MSIKKITVQIGKKDVDMSFSDAEKLYQDLHKLFGSKLTFPFLPVDTDIEWLQPHDVKITSGCLLDNYTDEEKSKGLLISCPCPKCSPQFMSTIS